MPAVLRILAAQILPLQLVLVVAGLAALALYPPAQGRMILVPVWPGAAAHLAANVIDRGGLLVEGGPLPGSLVVSGNRGAIAPFMLAHGVLVLAAPAAGCGTRIA